MKNRYIYLTFLLISSFAKSQIVNIPDVNFKNALLNHSPNIDLNNDNEIQISEASSYNNPINVTNYNYDFSSMISNFTGIEAFINMTKFIANNQSLYMGGFNFSFNPMITVIEIRGCSATQLDISNNNNLIKLDIEGNQISGLDFSNLLNLEELSVKNTNFTTIDLSQNTNLKKLSIFATDITSIDLSNNLALEDFSSGGAPLSFLNLANNINLKKLEIQGATYSSIDLSQNINLEHIACYGATVLNFDLSNNINLTYFGCGNNLFTTLDLSNNINLQSFVSQGNTFLQTINLKNGNNSNISNFEVLNHPNLTKVCVDDVSYAINNFTNIDNSNVFNICNELSIADSQYLGDVKIYPNPLLDNTLNIEVNSSIEVKELFFIDLSGRSIKIDSNNINQANNQIVINSELISSDFFFLKVVTNEGVFVKKIFKK